MTHFRARVLILSALALSMTGCVAQLKQRAAFDLDCSEDQLEVVDLGGPKGVKGCGRRATYVWTQQGWIMNSDARQQEGSPEQASPTP